MQHLVDDFEVELQLQFCKDRVELAHKRGESVKLKHLGHGIWMILGIIQQFGTPRTGYSHVTGSSVIPPGACDILDTSLRTVL